MSSEDIATANAGVANAEPAADVVVPPVNNVENRFPSANEDPLTMICRTMYNIWPVVLLCLFMTAMSIVFRNQIISVCTSLSEMDVVEGLLFWMIIFIFWVLVWLPTTVLELTSGFVFGVWWGTLINVAGKTASALVAFFLGRYVFKEYFVKEVIEKDIVLTSLSKLLKEREWISIHLIFLSYLHYSLKCYGLGTMPVTLPAFTSAILWSGFIYGIFNATIGASLRDVTDAANGGGGMSTMKVVMLSMGVTASVICIVFISMFTKRELERMREELDEAQRNTSTEGDVATGPIVTNRLFSKVPEPASGTLRTHRLSKVVPVGDDGAALGT